LLENSLYLKPPSPVLLSVENLSKSYGERELFRGLTFYIAPGQKIALVARNGTGKSSLMRVLAGLEPPDMGGSVSYHPDARVAFLPQEPELDPTQTILEAVFAAGSPAMLAVREYEDCLARHIEGDRLDRAIAGMEAYNAWDLEALVKQVLSRLDIHDVERGVANLSGGERKRVALARVLIEEPDLLILDEPTNHLDLDMVEWLEGYLMAQKRAMLLVTHDRYFLDSVCQEIIEIEQGELQRYRGNYSYYLQSKVERTDARNKTIEKARGLYKTELEWSKRMPQARATKSKYRMEAVQELRELATKRTDEDELELDVQTERLGSKILEMHNVSKGFGDRVLFQKFDYKFKRPDRIGIVGRNGSGKSTLLDLFTGAQEPDGGKVVRGETLHIGYYRQEGLKFREGQRVVDVVRDVAEFLPLGGGRKLTATQLLERFLFEKHTHYQHVSTLSGGERRRLYLLTILMKNPNLLILDEPTNDLDILTLSVLEDFLLRFPGCLVIVSHDRYFMDKLVDHLFVFESNGLLRDFHGNYSAYRAELDALEDQRRLESSNRNNKQAQSRSGEGLPSAAATAQAMPTAQAPAKAPAKTSAQASAQSAAKTSGNYAPSGSPKPKMGFKEKREFEALEARLAELETRKTDLESLLASGALPHAELTAHSAELGQVLRDLESKTDRWLELSEMA